MSDLIEYTAEMMQEITKCKNDVVYFAENYIYIDNDKIKLYDFQKELLTDWHEFRYNVDISARQMGLTTLEQIFIIWNCVFTSNYIVAFILHKDDICRYISESIVKHLNKLPVFMRPNMTHSNYRIRFENGSGIILDTCSSDCVRGQTVNLLLIDNPDHIRSEVFNNFWKSVIPTISSSKRGKIILAGSLGAKSIMGEKQENIKKFPLSHSDWKYRVISWNMHPDRDEKWKDEMKTLLGPNADEIFSLEFDCKQWYSDECPTPS